ncbi:sulfotransferase family protein [Allopontixanthobacter sediminis]|uniref:Sulfotransferase family protein n=1 Tax=Allopontixanthobacter sediminis TaxID=1689985 RepID=A0A845B5I9_9SPHN|nr:hypothetical protein [Allopontixanthobacter sediminis]
MSTTRVSKRIELINTCLAKAWQSGAAQVPQLGPEDILAKARQKSRAGPGDCSSPLSADWLERLSLLTGDLQQRADLTPLGRTIAHGQLVSAAANMLGMHRLWERHGEIEEQSLERPIIIVGQMRSGTTRLQRMLACDARFRFTKFHESWAPLPRAGWHQYSPSSAIDDRTWRARAGLIAAKLLNPEFQVMHPTSANAPDEEIGFFNMLMVPAAYEAQWRLPQFVRHCEAMDSTPVYLEFKRILKTIAWLRGGGHDRRPWILKVPQFAEDLGSLLRVFPDARVIHATRDRDAVVASSSSLVRSQMMLQSERVDPRGVGREWSRKVALRMERTERALATADVPRIEVAYHDVDQDWRKEIARIYAMLGLPRSHRTEEKMGRYLRASANGPVRRHRYDPADYGLPARRPSFQNPAGPANQGGRYPATI